MDYLESSGSSVMMSGRIVCQYVLEESETTIQTEILENDFFHTFYFFFFFLRCWFATLAKNSRHAGELILAEATIWAAKELF